MHLKDKGFVEGAENVNRINETLMKRLTLPIVCAALGAVFLFSKGDTAYRPEPRDNYEPVYMTRSELEGSVKYVEGERRMSDPGKIYVHGDRIFVNEKYRGVHIIDNSDPRNPRQTGFLVVPGCIDMAVKGEIVYVDNAVDLVTFDMASRTVTSRIRDYFPEHNVSPDGRQHDYPSGRPQGYILVRWDKSNLN